MGDLDRVWVGQLSGSRPATPHPMRDPSTQAVRGFCPIDTGTDASLRFHRPLATDPDRYSVACLRSGESRPPSSSAPLYPVPELCASVALGHTECDRRLIVEVRKGLVNATSERDRSRNKMAGSGSEAVLVVIVFERVKHLAVNVDPSSQLWFSRVKEKRRERRCAHVMYGPSSL